MHFEIVVFPQPDSPTSPIVLPLGITKETSSTAFTTPVTFFIIPDVRG